MADNKKHVYDESKIKTLSSLEHIRLRTGMYIGRIGDGSHYDDGCYILLKEVIDNAIDEFIMGHGKEVQIEIEDKAVTVRDFGRGIPLGKVVDCVSKINTGAKYNDDVFQFSVGLNGVGHQGGQRALEGCSWCAASARAQFVEASFKQGKLKNEKNGKAPKEAGRHADPSSSPTRRSSRQIEFRPEHVERRLRHYSYLNTGLQADLQRQDVPVAQRAARPGDGGLAGRRQRADLSAAALRGEDAGVLFHPQQQPLRRDVLLVRQRPIHERRRHAPERVPRGAAQGGQRIRRTRSSKATTCARAWSGRCRSGCKDPVFESQTKNKLGNTEIRTDLVNRVREELLQFFNRNKEIAEKIVAKVQDTRQLRKELQEVKKLARERAKAITIRIPQLKDCKEHFNKAKGKGKGTMVFITEGQSAAGSIVSCRDVETQAIFVLKGKPLNVWDLKRDIVYKNDEMYNLMRSLDIEDNLEGLRYDKVILATDADVDGLHIRNLLITYFFRFFDQLVHDGHLFVLETPLFRVRNKEQTIYCYSEAERDAAAAKLGKSCEITRFKGLGEINPTEFKQFIGKEMRLSQVEYAPKQDAAGILGFYMGKNTPERKDYIMENLVVPVED